MIVFLDANTVQWTNEESAISSLSSIDIDEIHVFGQRANIKRWRPVIDAVSQNFEINEYPEAGLSNENVVRITIVALELARAKLGSKENLLIISKVKGFSRLVKTLEAQGMASILLGNVSPDGVNHFIHEELETYTEKVIAVFRDMVAANNKSSVQIGQWANKVCNKYPELKSKAKRIEVFGSKAFPKIAILSGLHVKSHRIFDMSRK